MERQKSDRRRRLGGWVLVVGTLGTALGVGSGAEAARLLTGKQIKDGTVTSRDVRDGTITGKDVSDGGITLPDYDGDVSGGPGPRGEQGPTGLPGLELTGYAASGFSEVGPGEISLVVTACDDGQVAIGGGFDTPAGVQLQLLDSSPLGPAPDARNGWAVRVHNPSTAPVGMDVWAICSEVR